MTFLWLLFNPWLHPTTPNLQAPTSAPPQYPSFSFTLCHREVRRHLFQQLETLQQIAASVWYNRSRSCLLGSLAYIFIEGKNILYTNTPMNIFFYLTEQTKFDVPDVKSKGSVGQKVFTNFCICSWCMTSSASLLFLQLPVWASLLHHKAVFIFIGSLCSLKIWFEEVGACERVCKNSIDAILWSNTQPSVL